MYSRVWYVVHQPLRYNELMFNVFYALQQEFIQKGANYLDELISHMCHMSYCYT